MALGNYPWQSTKPGRSRIFDWVFCAALRPSGTGHETRGRPSFLELCTSTFERSPKMSAQVPITPQEGKASLARRQLWPKLRTWLSTALRPVHPLPALFVKAMASPPSCRGAKLPVSQTKLARIKQNISRPLQASHPVRIGLLRCFAHGFGLCRSPFPTAPIFKQRWYAICLHYGT